ncbi:MAG: FGGY-family carbohydrate kinase [Devosia sp.]
MGDLLAAVDVGTGSARAGLFTGTGRLLGRAEHPIVMRRRSANEAEHDSEDIWAAVTTAMRGAMAAAGAKPEDIAAIAFDATCSLVVRGGSGEQVAVAPDGEARWDTIVWFDHRAMAEAAECTATDDAVLQHLGGVMSPEMQVPKLMWLKRHLPASWAAMGGAYDLADFLTFRATGSNARSQSTLACKWQWGAGSAGWPRGFFDKVGLGDLIERAQLPEAATPPGTNLGPLTATAASQLGLTTKAHVAAGLIDAHAAALGMLGAAAGKPGEIDKRVCLVAGTSNSVMAHAPDARRIAGVWGPTDGAILPGLWLLEAGQSASGALLDHLIRSHPAGGTPDAARHKAIAERIAVLREAEDFAARLHVLPDFHGNRSPLAEPSALGVVSGLGLDTDFDSLCRLYWRTAVALALGIRQNLDVLREAGFDADRLLLAGGHARNDLLVGLYADATGSTVVEPNAPDVVLLGGAMLAATAAGLYPSLAGAAAVMDQGGVEREPETKTKASFDRDYRIFLEMQRQRQVIEGM